MIRDSNFPPGSPAQILETIPDEDGGPSAKDRCHQQSHQGLSKPYVTHACISHSRLESTRYPHPP